MHFLHAFVFPFHFAWGINDVNMRAKTNCFSLRNLRMDIIFNPKKDISATKIAASTSIFSLWISFILRNIQKVITMLPVKFNALQCSYKIFQPFNIHCGWGVMERLVLTHSHNKLKSRTQKLQCRFNNNTNGPGF